MFSFLGQIKACVNTICQFGQVFLHSFQWILFLTLSCLAMYCVTLAKHSLPLLFSFTLLILALTKLVLMALFWAAVSNLSVSLFKFPLLNHVQIITCTISLLYLLKNTYSCFSLHFCFLDFLVVVFLFLLELFLLLLRLLAALTILSLFFFIYSLIIFCSHANFFLLLFLTHRVYIISQE